MRFEYEPSCPLDVPPGAPPAACPASAGEQPHGPSQRAAWAGTLASHKRDFAWQHFSKMQCLFKARMKLREENVLYQEQAKCSLCKCRKVIARGL